MYIYIYDIKNFKRKRFQLYKLLHVLSSFMHPFLKKVSILKLIALHLSAGRSVRGTNVAYSTSYDLLHGIIESYCM